MFTEKAGDPEHTHRIDVDGEGTGQTTDTIDGPVHTHKIVNWIVDCSEVMKERGDEHIHKIEHDCSKVHDMQDIPKVESPAGKPHVQMKIEINMGEQSEDRSSTKEGEEKDKPVSVRDK